jgi:uroporphyrinogen-III decarboxylase
MTGKERILCTLSGGIPDRVPVTLFVQQEYLSYYYKKSGMDRVKDAALLAAELGFDLITRQRTHEEPFWTRKSYPNWELTKREEISGGNIHRRLEIKTPGGILSQTESAPYDPSIVEGVHFITTQFMINTPEDFELFRKYMPVRDKAYFEEMKDAAADAHRLVGDLGICSPWGPGGVFNAACILRDISQLCMDPYEDEDFYHEFMGFLASVLEKDYELLAETEHECLGMQGNMANGALVGPDFFRKNMQPYEQRLIDVVKSRGKYVLYHNCGPAKNLYGNYKEMKMSVWETISPPPQGDNDIAEAKEILGKDLVLSGNLDQIHFLKEAGVDEVCAATERLINICKSGGKYLFDTSDYLESNTPLENVKAMIETVKVCGKY